MLYQNVNRESSIILEFYFSPSGIRLPVPQENTCTCTQRLSQRGCAQFCRCVTLQHILLILDENHLYLSTPLTLVCGSMQSTCVCVCQYTQVSALRNFNCGCYCKVRKVCFLPPNYKRNNRKLKVKDNQPQFP